MRSTIAELDQMERAMVAVLAQTDYVIAVDPGNAWFAGKSPNTRRLPSDLYEEVIHDPSSKLARPLRALLDNAASGQALGRGDHLACFRSESMGSSDMPPLEATVARARAAKSLDAVIRIRVEYCAPQDAVSLNSPGASMPSDTDSAAIASEAEVARRNAIDAAFKTPAEAQRALMLAQGYHFANTDDADVPLPSFLQQGARDAEATMQDAYQQFKPGSKRRRVVFDRSQVKLAGLANSPRGWFNAIALDTDPPVLYVSPTLVRSSLFACADIVKTAASTRARLRDETLPALARRDLTPADVRNTVAYGHGMFVRMQQCVAEQMSFLMAHELAHSYLGVISEERADCIGRAVAVGSGQQKLGVLQTIIFNAAGTSDEILLGADAATLAEIACRRNASYLRSKGAPSSTGEAIQGCLSMALVCTRPSGPDVPSGRS